MKKFGMVFFSSKVHKIKIQNIKLMQIDKVLYLKTTTKLVIINNVEEVKIYNGYLYFKGCGKVTIEFDCKEFYKYFALKISSKQFCLSDLKQQAFVDLMNNGFDKNFSKLMKKYINIIKNVLKIEIFKEKIVVGYNKFKLSFVLTYKLNNVIKRINVY